MSKFNLEIGSSEWKLKLETVKVTLFWEGWGEQQQLSDKMCEISLKN
jgi:hypothetical protein